VKEQQAAKLAQTTAGGKPLPQHDWMHHFRLPRFLSPTTGASSANGDSPNTSAGILADTFRRRSYPTQEEPPSFQVRTGALSAPCKLFHAAAAPVTPMHAHHAGNVQDMQARAITDPHLQYSDADLSMLSTYMGPGGKPSGSAGHMQGDAPFLQHSAPMRSLPQHSRPMLNLPQQPLRPGVLPEDALRRESRSVPIHAAYGGRGNALPDGECAAAAAAQLLFADKMAAEGHGLGAVHHDGGAPEHVGLAGLHYLASPRGVSFSSGMFHQDIPLPTGPLPRGSAGSNLLSGTQHHLGLQGQLRDDSAMQFCGYGALGDGTVVSTPSGDQDDLAKLARMYIPHPPDSAGGTGNGQQSWAGVGDAGALTEAGVRAAAGAAAPSARAADTDGAPDCLWSMATTDVQDLLVRFHTPAELEVDDGSGAPSAAVSGPPEGAPAGSSGELGSACAGTPNPTQYMIAHGGTTRSCAGDDTLDGSGTALDGASGSGSLPRPCSHGGGDDDLAQFLHA
jgi:hypothetical protein